MNNELRWQQRFANFDKAYRNFIQIADYRLEDLSDLEKEGFVQRFEYTLELAWKTLKDYLLEQGFDLASPKAVIRQAFQNEIITDGEVWMEALSRRNLTSHTSHLQPGGAGENPDVSEERVLPRDSKDARHTSH